MVADCHKETGISFADVHTAFNLSVNLFFSTIQQDARIGVALK
jgi:hypothetical protein